MVCLPVEVLEHILSFCDGETLYSASLSCECLKELSTRPSIQKVWKRACHSLPTFYLTDILESFNPKHHYEAHELDWLNIYKLWKKWTSTRSWSVGPFIQKERVRVRFAPKLLNFCITTSAVTGKWLITASLSCLTATDLETNKVKVIFSDTFIISFRFSCELSPDCVDSSRSWLPGVEHDKVIITLDRNVDAILNLHTGFRTYVNNIGRWEDIRQFENHVIRVRREGEVEVHYCNVFQPDEDMTWTQYRFEGEPYLVDMWQSKAVFSWEGSLKLFDPTLGNKHPIVRSKSIPSKLILEARYCKLRIFFDEKCNQFGKALNIEYEDNPPLVIYPETYELDITCATFRAGILVFGCADGNVLAYKFTSLEKILSLNLSQYFWSYNLGGTDIQKSHIVNIEIQFKENIYFWITTKKRVFKLAVN